VCSSDLNMKVGLHCHKCGAFVDPSNAKIIREFQSDKPIMVKVR